MQLLLPYSDVVYAFFIIGIVIAAFIKSNIISNIIIFGYLMQTCMITRLAYRLTNNRYGYEYEAYSDYCHAMAVVDHDGHGAGVIR